VGPRNQLLDIAEHFELNTVLWAFHTIQPTSVIPVYIHKVGNLSIFKSYLLRHLQWEMANDHGFLN